MKSTSKASDLQKGRTAQFRSSVMARACVLVLSTVAAGGAIAQTATYSYTFGTAPVLLPSYISPQTMTLSTYINNILNDQVNYLAPVSAPVSTAGILASVAAGATPITLTGSSITSTARANGSVLAPYAATNTLDLGSVTIPGSTGEGAMILSGQLAGGDLAASTPINSSVSGGNITITATATSPAQMVLKSNTIGANTVVNDVVNTFTGTLPSGYSSTQVGSVDAAFDGTVLPPTINATVTGGLQITNVQTALNAGQRAGSSATVTDSNVALNINAMAGTETKNLTVNSNTIAADFTVNQSTNTFTAGGTDNFTGSVTNTNLQTNVETAGAGALPTASISGSSITADYRNEVGNASTSMSGSLTLSKNTIGASSTGNSGNTFTTFSTGADIAGTGSLVGNTLAIPNDQLNASVQSDVVVLNGQGNANTGLMTTVTGGSITARGDDLEAGGAVTVNSNTISAASTGNTAASGVSATASAVSATIAAGNIQANDATTITATNSGATVAAEIGIAGGSTSGTITVSKNTLSATATGSAANTGVVLSTTSIDNALAGPSSVSSTYPGGFEAIDSTASLSVNNVQGNHGGATISATLSDASVSADSEDTFTPPANPEVAVSGATITLNKNVLQAAATGNTAVSGVVLDGTTVTTSAAVGNSQYNNNLITGTVSGPTGVTSLVRGVTDSSISITKNTVSASATGNAANNILIAGTTDPVTGDVNTVANLTAGPATFAGATSSSDANNAGTGAAVTTAAFGIASGQVNEGDITASNITTGAFAQIEAGRGTGITGGSTLTVNSNVASADAVANQSQNQLLLNAGQLASSTGVASQIAGITNFQSNNTLGTSSATVGGDGGQLIGIRFRDSVVGADNTLTVSNNEVRATIAGNTTGNTLAVTGTGYTSTTAATPTGVAAADNAGAASVTNEFALVNNQVDSARSRTATVQEANIGIDDAGTIGTVNGTFTVSGNRVDADARNNSATNSLSLSGFTDLTTGAGLVNQQSSSTPVSASVEDRIRIRAGSGATAVSDATMVVDKNASQALAVGNFANNAVQVDATNLTGNANIATGSNTFDPATGLAVTADFGLANVQNQTGSVGASVDSSVRINLNGSTVADSTLDITRNTVNAIAVSNSAGNQLSLSGTTVAASAGVGSMQSASGPVTATQTTPPAEFGTFTIMNDAPTGLVDTVSTVSRNSVLANAVQNEVDNKLTVDGTTVSGRGLGSNTSSFVPGTGIAASGADFSVVNVQSSAGGNITATATPGLIGADVLLIDGGSMTINKNSVTASANVNNSANSLAIDGAGDTAVLSATGAVVNAQTTAAQTVNATIGAAAPGTVTQVGIASTAGLPVALNATTATISGNTLAATATGNNTNNTLVASSGAVVDLAATGQTFAVLNYQTSAATLNALVQNAVIGINASGLGVSGGLTSLSGTVATVNGNSLAAVAGGNTATNSMDVSSGATFSGGGSTPAFLLSSTQTNSGAVSSSVLGAAIGINAGGLGGSVTTSPVTIGSNTVLASGYGNTASNSIALASVSSSTASAGLINSQLNTGSITSTITGATIGLTATTAGGTSPIVISNNSISAVAVGNSANNSITSK